jgi:hypothetical protein
LNKSDLEKILKGPAPSGEPHINAIRKFLKENVKQETGKLEVPHCFISLQHAFTCTLGHLVTIQPIEPNPLVDDPDTPGRTIRPESFSLLGVWAADKIGKGVTVLTTEAEYKAAYRQEKANQRKMLEKEEADAQ